MATEPLPPPVESELARAFETAGDWRLALDEMMRRHPRHESAIRQRVQRADALWQTLGFDGGEVATGKLGRFVLCEQLGRGGMGVVYRAFDPLLAREVAIKCLRAEAFDSPKARLRFEREGRALSRLQHANLAQVFEVGEDGSTPFIVMRFVRGVSLAARLHAAAAPASRDDMVATVALIEKIARALHHAHARQIVHRDVKPENIVVDEDGEPVLTDFGLAWDEGAASSLTGGQLLGTPAYMAPEQILPAGRSTSAATDVWGLGVTLYECLTLAPPFSAPTQHELSQAILNAEPRNPQTVNPAVSRDLAVVIATAMAKEPERRYRSAEAFADDLARIREHRPILARPQGAMIRLRRWTRRNPLPTLLLLITSGLATAAFLLAGSATTNLQRYNLLAVDARLDAAIAAERTLYPACAERADAMRAWIRDHGEPLAAAIPTLDQALQRMRTDAERLPAGAPIRDAATGELEDWLQQADTSLAEIAESLADPAVVGTHRRSLEAEQRHWQARRRQWREMLGTGEQFAFTDPDQQFLHDRITQLLERLRGFAQSESGLLARVRERLRWAETVHQRSVTDQAAAWQRAIEAVAASEVYAHLILTPQVGLVPIGADPQSRLQEFVHLRSGDVPVRDPSTGELQITDTTGIVFVLIPAQRAILGAQSADPGGGHFDAGARLDERLTEVALDAFFLAKHEVTQAQWLRLSGGDNPSRYRIDRHGEHVGPRNPVETVSWNEATAILEQHGLMLPTEAQWECACRGGTSTPWSCGRDANRLAACANLVDASAGPSPTWDANEPWSDGHYQHAPVGSFAANPFGLHDMHGNVEEWCADTYAPYGRQRPGDGLLTSAGSQMRIVRGGSYQHDRERARSARRTCDSPGVRTDARGLRAARAVEPGPAGR